MSEGPRVYVVDDDASIRKGVSRLLRLEGFRVEAFDSAAAFLAQDDLPDEPICVLLDVRMPGLTGIELQGRLVGAGVDVGFVFLTGHGDVRTTVTAMKAGAIDVLEKPVDVTVLVPAIRRALAVSERTRATRARREDLRARYRVLTPREREVLELVAAGLPNKNVADRLGTSEKTIKVHRGRVMAKMGAPSLAELVRMVEQLASRE